MTDIEPHRLRIAYIIAPNTITVAKEKSVVYEDVAKADLIINIVEAPLRARIAELEAENEELKKAISKPWMGSARAALEKK